MQMYELLTPLRRRGAEPVPAGATIPLAYDDGEALVKLGAAIRADAAEIAPAATDADREERRRDLLRQLADVSRVPDGLLVVVAPSSAGDYVMKVGPDGVSDIQPFLDIDPLADADAATIRRHHLDALRDLDDLTYLVLDDNAAADLGQIAMLELDPGTGIVVSVTQRPAVPIGVDVVDAPAAGTGAVDGAGEVLPPVASDPVGEAVVAIEAEPVSDIVPASDDALATMTKAQLLKEAARVGAQVDANPTKAELVTAIAAKQAVA